MDKVAFALPSKMVTLARITKKGSTWLGISEVERKLVPCLSRAAFLRYLEQAGMRGVTQIQTKHG